MGKFFEQINDAHREFIANQHMFFVATSPLNEDGRINLSPKGLDSFRILSSNKVAYMDLLSSGNETSAHILENGRITFMFCSFDKTPGILRLYGKAHCILKDSENWDSFSKDFIIHASTRQIIVAEIDLVQTSCGFGIPQYEYLTDRDIYFEWAAKKNDEDRKAYILEKNMKSIDGLPTHLSLCITGEK